MKSGNVYWLREDLRPAIEQKEAPLDTFVRLEAAGIDVYDLVNTAHRGVRIDIDRTEDDFLDKDGIVRIGPFVLVEITPDVIENELDPLIPDGTYKADLDSEEKIQQWLYDMYFGYFA